MPFTHTVRGEVFRFAGLRELLANETALALAETMLRAEKGGVSIKEDVTPTARQLPG